MESNMTGDMLTEVIKMEDFILSQNTEKMIVKVDAIAKRAKVIQEEEPDYTEV